MEWLKSWTELVRTMTYLLPKGTHLDKMTFGEVFCLECGEE